MKFNELKGFVVKTQENTLTQESKNVKAQRSQCRTTHKRQDC